MSHQHEYVVLIIGDDTRWERMTEDELAAGMAVHEAFSRDLHERGHTIVGGAELHFSTEAKVVPTGGGPITDGPFAESAEHVGGFYQVRTSDLDDLLECCRLLAAAGDAIEVRQVVHRDDS